MNYRYHLWKHGAYSSMFALSEGAMVLKLLKNLLFAKTLQFACHLH